MHALCAAAINGEHQKAKELNKQLTPFFINLGAETNPIAIKWALHASALIKEGIRLPLTPLSTKYRAALMNSLQQIPSH